MADNGNDGEDTPPPLPRGTYNFNFDDLDENTNPFQSTVKMGSSPPINHGIIKVPADASPFKPKSKLARSPSRSPTAGPKVVTNLNSGDAGFNENIDPFMPRRTVQNSPPSSPVHSVSKQSSVEIIHNTVEEVIIDDDADAFHSGESPNIKGKPQEGKSHKRKGKPKEGESPNIKGKLKEGESPNTKENHQEGESPDIKGKLQEEESPEIKGKPQEGESPDLKGKPQDGGLPHIKGKPQEDSPLSTPPITPEESQQELPSKSGTSPQPIKQSSKKKKKSKRLSAEITAMSPPVAAMSPNSENEAIKGKPPEKQDDPPNNNNKIEASDMEVAKVMDSENVSSVMDRENVSSVMDSENVSSKMDSENVSSVMESENVSSKSTAETMNSMSPTKLASKKDAAKKSAKIKKPIKPKKTPGPVEEDIHVPTCSPKATQEEEPASKHVPDLLEKNTNINANPAKLAEANLPPASTFVIGEVEQGTQPMNSASYTVEPGGGQDNLSQTDDGMGESVQDDFPGDYPEDCVPRKASVEEEDEQFVDCVEGGVHEFSTSDDHGLGDMGDEPNEEFVPAAEAFSDPNAWEMLEKLGGESNFKDTDLARQSLYVKFDPLAQDSTSAAKTQAKDKTPNVPDSTKQGDGLLMQMNTPPVQSKKGSSSKQSKHPAAKRLEQHVEGSAEASGAREMDRIYATSPHAGEKADSGHAGSACTASPPNIGPGEDSDELVDMLKFSQHDLNKLRQDMEMEFQGRLLSKEKDWSKKHSDLEKERSNLRDQVEKIKAAHEDMKCIVSDYEKTISQLVADKEKSSSESKESIVEIIKDRDQAVEDLRSVEAAFSDLHRRYEKIKTVVEGYKKNEEILKKSVQDYQGKLKSAEQRFQSLKQQAEDKLNQANVEIDKVRRTTSAELARLDAAVKKKDLQVKSLDKSLEQKVKENEELTAICDELISKVGTQ